MELDLNIAIFTVLSCVAGYLMMLAGLGKHALELRRPARRCPSCGKRIQARVCSGCTAA